MSAEGIVAPALVPEAATRGWVSLCAGLVVSLTLAAAWVDRETPYWSVANVLGSAAPTTSVPGSVQCEVRREWTSDRPLAGSTSASF